MEFPTEIEPMSVYVVFTANQFTGKRIRGILLTWERRSNLIPRADFFQCGLEAGPMTSKEGMYKMLSPARHIDDASVSKLYADEVVQLRTAVRLNEKRQNRAELSRISNVLTEYYGNALLWDSLDEWLAEFLGAVFQGDVRFKKFDAFAKAVIDKVDASEGTRLFSIWPAK